MKGTGEPELFLYGKAGCSPCDHFKAALDLLDVQPGDTCLAIASAGDNALALLTRAPARVVAVDYNPAQLAGLALRVAAYRCLSHAELLELVGSRPSTQRAALYARCRPALDPEARVFWDARPQLIAGGIGLASMSGAFSSAAPAPPPPAAQPADAPRETTTEAARAPEPLTTTSDAATTTSSAPAAQQPPEIIVAKPDDTVQPGDPVGQGGADEAPTDVTPVAIPTPRPRPLPRRQAPPKPPPAASTWVPDGP